MLDPLRYYDLEGYLFDEVGPRFREKEWLSAFDFFSIVIWKSNRSKSYIAKKIQRIAKAQNLDFASRQLTSEIALAQSKEARFRVLFKGWEMRLPMTSAILTVLYPEDFTVYDTRGCSQLGDFQWISNRSKFETVWEGYCDFLVAVRARVPEKMPLRDKDRYLFGLSVKEQLEHDIRNGFVR
jgi:hypothetical protein